MAVAVGKFNHIETVIASLIVGILDAAIVSNCLLNLIIIRAYFSSNTFFRLERSPNILVDHLGVWFEESRWGTIGISIMDLRGL